MSKRLTKEEFIEKSVLKHGYKFDYSKVEYVNNSTKVIIICENKHIFEQTPCDHMSGYGCRKCHHNKMSKLLSHTTDKFIEKAKLRHGDKYGYSYVDYKSDAINVRIECFKHGIFNQSPSNHLRGAGCYYCGRVKTINSQKKTTEQFVKEAIEVHGDRYGYSESIYIKNNIKVKIKCGFHGNFYQLPSDHLSGKGCKKCGNNEISIKLRNTPSGWGVSGWDKKAKSSKRFDSFKVYIIKCWNGSETFYKIGRTFLKTQQRFYSVKGIPYEYKILDEIVFDKAKDCFDKENELKRLNKQNKYIPLIPFGGRYECFSKLFDYSD